MTVPARLIVIAVLASLVAVSHAAAQSPTAEEQARELFDRAVSLLAEEHYGEAHDLLVEALELDPRASTAFNLASVLVGLNRAREASDLLDRVERGEYGELPEEHAGSVQALRAAIEARLGYIEIRAHGAPAIDIELDGTLLETVAEDSVTERQVDPGIHEVRGIAEGHTTATERVTIGAGERRRVELVLETVLPTPPPRRPVADPPMREPRIDGGGGSPWPWIGLAGALAVGAAVVIVLVLSADDGGRPFDCDPVFGCTDV